MYVVTGRYVGSLVSGIRHMPVELKKCLNLTGPRWKTAVKSHVSQFKTLFLYFCLKIQVWLIFAQE
jgi:hypothetical protein